MSDPPQVARLADGDRLHLHHGPIDLIIDAEGPDREAAFTAATTRFQTVLTGLTAELDVLTRPFEDHPLKDPIAQRMATAIAPLAKDRFVTPMAAVAGSVADEILATMARHTLTKAHVNNGGDIAFHLVDGQSFRSLAPTGTIEIAAHHPIRGIATSGWRGRSQSLGIADAVTVLASTAARADAAATLIANAVDLPGHPAITRHPAHEIEAIPQLRDRPVTTDVGALIATEIATALDAGVTYAHTLIQRNLITAAALTLQGDTRLLDATGAFLP